MPGFASSRAVIVGINAYGNGVPALRSAVNDARDLAKILGTDHGYSVTLLVDCEATLASLKRQFESVLPDQVKADDRVLVYFAGHGIAEEGDDGPTGYLLPQDARRDDRASFLPMETFREWLGKLRCRHLLVVLDCCFAGAFRWTKQTRHVRVPLAVMHRERYERFIRHPTWQVIASTAYDQEALDTIAGKVLGLRQAPDSTPNSPFARALFEGLKGEADLVPKNGDGVIVSYELATFLQDSVSRGADGARHEQMPCIWSLGKEGSGQFIFLLPHFDLDTLKPAPALDAESNPYRGLSAYEESDAGLFFGREKVIEDLAEVVRKQPLTMVLGASGTGKSSLVRAGLLSYPRKIAAAAGAADAEAAGDAVLFGKDAAAEGAFHRLLMRPADAPAMPLSVLMTRLSTVGSTAPGAALSEGLSDETPAAAVAAFSAWFAADPQRHLFLVIDQFEELVTLCNNEVRSTFLNFLADLLDRERERLRIVLTLRSDFEPQFADSALQRHLHSGEETLVARFLVPPLQHHEFREIIENPASERVLFFDPPALVDRLITEVIQMPGALPLLSFALSELYLKYVERQTAAQQRGEIIDRAISEEDYRQLGGVVGALSKRATEECGACDEAHRRTMQRVMLRMVATEGELARRRVPRDELIYPGAEETTRANAVVERLEKARLVVSGRTNRSDHGDGGSEYVEPAHDALVRAWGKLLEWQREAAAELPVQRRLTEAAAEWTRRKRDSGLLWTSDPRLALVRQQFTAADSWLNARETDFVEASTRRRRRNQRIRWAAIAGLVVLTAASLIAADRAVKQERVAQINRSQALTALAQIEVETGSPATAVRLALAVTEAPTGSTATVVRTETHMFVDSLLLKLWEWRRLEHHTPLNSAVFSPDGGTLATGSDDGTARLWDVATGNEIKVLRGHHDDEDSDVPVFAVAFSPDGRTLATGSEDGTARLWDLETGEIKVLRGHHDDEDSDVPVFAIAFSPDSRTLATGSEDGTARLWDLETGEIKVLRDHDGDEDSNFPVLSVAFSPDGRTLATGSEDDSARLWDLKTGEIQVLWGHENSVSSVAFSRDGNRFATGSQDHTARLWDLETGEIQVLRGHENSVSSVAFSRDGILATGSWDGTARLWKSPPLPRRLDHKDKVNSVTFGPDGRTLATGSSDGTARLWNVATGNVKLLEGHTEPVSSVVFGPDGRTLATGSSDGTAQLWDLATGNVKRLEGHKKPVTSVAFSPDGRTLATGSEDGTARLWEVATGNEIKRLEGHESSVTSVAFSQDGRTLATGSWDNSARLWNLATGNEIKVLRGHREPVLSVAFSPDGGTLATGSEDHTARLWDVATGDEIATLPHNNQVWSVAFKPGGRILATGSFSNEIVFWGMETRQKIAVLKQDHAVLSVAFSPDGSLLATGSKDKKAWLWPLSRQPVHEACARVQNLPLSGRARQQFGIENEWCTPKFAATLRTELGLDMPEASASAAVR